MCGWLPVWLPACLRAWGYCPMRVCCARLIERTTACSRPLAPRARVLRIAWANKLPLMVCISLQWCLSVGAVVITFVPKYRLERQRFLRA